MPPEALILIEDIPLLKGYIITTEIMVLPSQLLHLLLILIVVLNEDFQRKRNHDHAADEIPHHRHELVDLSPVQLAHQVPQDLGDLDESAVVGFQLFALTQLHVEVCDELQAVEHAVQRNEDLLQAQEDVAAQVGVADGVL
jgi:hypothetical protein